MYYDVTDVAYKDKYNLEVSFNDGKKSIVNLENYIKQKGVFKKLANINRFKQAYVNKDFGSLCWPGDIDFASETLYSIATHSPLPGWMDKD